MKEPKLIYSKIFPFKGFSAMTFFGCILRREEYRDKPVNPVTYNHEKIHIAQAYDFHIGFCGYFIFYILYFIEWLIKLFAAKFQNHTAYRSISFEQEAYANEKDMEYIDNRKKFSWKKFIFKLI